MKIIRRDRAVMLSAKALSDSQRVVSFFSQQWGRQEGVYRLSRTRKGGGLLGESALAPLNGLTVTWEEKATPGFHRLVALDVDDSVFEQLTHLSTLSYAQWLADLVNRLFPLNQSDPRVFRLLLHVNEDLRANPPSSTLRVRGAYVALWLLQLSGLTPQWDSPLTQLHQERQRKQPPEDQIGAETLAAVMKRVVQAMTKQTIEEFSRFAIEWGLQGEIWEGSGLFLAQALDRELPLRRAFTTYTMERSIP
jgi:hypothetical protein